MGVHNFDIALNKSIPIFERLRLELRADFINAFNHPFLTSMASLDVTNPSFGQLNLSQNNEPTAVFLLVKLRLSHGHGRARRVRTIDRELQPCLVSARPSAEQSDRGGGQRLAPAGGTTSNGGTTSESLNARGSAFRCDTPAGGKPRSRSRNGGVESRRDSYRL
jgi:hypothetical protein